jgi:uncharacterized protein
MYIQGMNRTLEILLEQWRTRPNRKPLIIRGARQVGKTFTVTKFGKEKFVSLFRIDFTENPAYRRMFEGSLSPSDIILQLEAHFGEKIIPGACLLFFDEIQACPNALKSLRFFFEKLPVQHIIAAGSLLEFSLNHSSFPVGSVEYMWMYPMDFYEFLSETGNAILLEHIPVIFQSICIPDTIHELINNQVKLYSIVGGMPEAVKEYRRNRSIVDAHKVHADLFQSYIDDIGKYSGRMDITDIDIIMTALAKNVGKQIKYSSLAPEWRSEKTKKVLEVLEKMLFTHKVMATQSQGIPLGASVTDKIFKCLYLDIGLMHTVCGVAPLETIHTKNLLDIFRGALAEQFVGQQILAQGGCENRKMFYWSRQEKNSLAEIDYVIARSGKIFPVEIKSGPQGKLRSMSLFLKEHLHIEKGVVMYAGNIVMPENSPICYYPLYSRIE